MEHPITLTLEHTPVRGERIFETKAYYAFLDQVRDAMRGAEGRLALARYAPDGTQLDIVGVVPPGGVAGSRFGFDVAIPNHPKAWSEIVIEDAPPPFDGIRFSWDPATLTVTIDYRVRTWAAAYTVHCTGIEFGTRLKVALKLIDLCHDTDSGDVWTLVRAMNAVDVDVYDVVTRNSEKLVGQSWVYKEFASLAKFEELVGTKRLPVDVKHVIVSLGDVWQGRLEDLVATAHATLAVPAHA